MIVPMSARAARPGNHNRPSYRRARPLSRLSPRPVSIGHLCKSRLIIFNQIRPRRCADDRRDVLTLARGPAGRANNYGRQFPQLVDAVARFFTIYSTLVSINETRKASFRLPVVDDFASTIVLSSISLIFFSDRNYFAVGRPFVICTLFDIVGFYEVAGHCCEKGTSCEKNVSAKYVRVHLEKRGKCKLQILLQKYELEYYIVNFNIRNRP